MYYEIAQCVKRTGTQFAYVSHTCARSSCVVWYMFALTRPGRDDVFVSQCLPICAHMYMGRHTTPRTHNSAHTQQPPTSIYSANIAAHCDRSAHVRRVRAFCTVLHHDIRLPLINVCSCARIARNRGMRGVRGSNPPHYSNTQQSCAKYLC